MKKIILSGVQYGVMPTENPETKEKGVVLQFRDPKSEDLYDFPMSEGDADNIAGMLRGEPPKPQLEIAQSMPQAPMPVPPNGEAGAPPPMPQGQPHPVVGGPPAA